MKLNMDVGFVGEVTANLMCCKEGLSPYVKSFDNDGHELLEVSMWYTFLEGKNITTNLLNFGLNYIPGVILTITVSAFNWTPTPEDQEGVMGYLQPLLDKLEIGVPETLLLTQRGKDNTWEGRMILRWVDEEHQDINDLIKSILGTDPLS